jgi:uncharacterized protein YfaS (alpha-2-macroglobulin family)
MKLRATIGGSVNYDAPLPPIRSRRADVTQAVVGEVLALDIRVRAKDHERDVIIDVPLPAGLELVDPDAATDRVPLGPRAVAHHDFDSDHIERRPERVLLVPGLLEGLAQHTLFLRARLAGSYQMPAPRAEVMANPETHGRGRSMRVTVLPAPGRSS